VCAVQQKRKGGVGGKLEGMMSRVGSPSPWTIWGGGLPSQKRELKREHGIVGWTNIEGGNMVSKVLSGTSARRGARIHLLESNRP